MKGLSQERHRASVRQQPSQDLEQGGFARAVGAYDAGPDAMLKSHIQPVKYLDISKYFTGWM